MVVYRGKCADTSPWLTRVYLMSTLALAAPTLASTTGLSSFDASAPAGRSAAESKFDARTNELTKSLFVLDDAQRARIALALEDVHGHPLISKVAQSGPVLLNSVCILDKAFQ